MPHARQVIRDAIVAILTADVGVIHPVVAASPLKTARGKLPRILVYTTGDDAADELVEESPPLYSRTCHLVVECLIDVSAALASELLSGLDDMTAAVEAAMADSLASFLDGTVQGFRYRSTTIGLDAEDKTKPTAVARMAYDVVFFTRASGTLVDLAGTDVDYHLGDPGQPDGPHAEDFIDHTGG